jgi:hypothetical protein
MIISLPYNKGAKVAATAKNYDAKLDKPGTIVGLSVYDSSEALNGDLIQVSLLDENAVAVYHFPDGIAGGDTVYSWNGAIPANSKWTIRITVTGATATTPDVGFLVRPRGQA